MLFVFVCCPVGNYEDGNKVYYCSACLQLLYRPTSTALSKHGHFVNLLMTKEIIISLKLLRLLASPFLLFPKRVPRCFGEEVFEFKVFSPLGPQQVFNLNYLPLWDWLAILKILPPPNMPGRPPPGQQLFRRSYGKPRSGRCLSYAPRSRCISRPSRPASHSEREACYWPEGRRENAVCL